MHSKDPASRRFRLTLCSLVAMCSLLLLVAPPGLLAEEVVLRNDTLADGAIGAIQLGFVEDERAAAWLTSSCDGDLTKVQVFWASGVGTSGNTLQNSVSVWRAGTFPQAGALEEELLGPVLTDRAINEFTLAQPVAVAENETVVASLRFIASPLLNGGASVVTDIDGCKAQRNAIWAQQLLGGFAWVDACSFGLSGDFVIRAVVACDAAPEVIHSDDFESNSFDAWSEVVGAAP